LQDKEDLVWEHSHYRCITADAVVRAMNAKYKKCRFFGLL